LKDVAGLALLPDECLKPAVYYKYNQEDMGFETDSLSSMNVPIEGSGIERYEIIQEHFPKNSHPLSPNDTDLQISPQLQNSPRRNSNPNSPKSNKNSPGKILNLHENSQPPSNQLETLPNQEPTTHQINRTSELVCIGKSESPTPLKVSP
jgi:hypothetical protein